MKLEPYGCECGLDRHVSVSFFPDQSFRSKNRRGRSATGSIFVGDDGDSCSLVNGFFHQAAPSREFQKADLSFLLPKFTRGHLSTIK